MGKFSLLLLGAALAFPYVNAASANACAKAPYKDLLVLSKYPPAESYCTSKYPLPASTTTITVTASSFSKRGNPTTTTTVKKTTATTKAPTAPTTTPTKPTTSACTSYCSTWSSCTKSAGNFVSTLCSCIETTPTITVTTTVTPKPTYTPIPHCSETNFNIAGPVRAGSYWTPFCDRQYYGTIVNSTYVSDIYACAFSAGYYVTGVLYAAPFNFYDQTGKCDVFQVYSDYKNADPSEGVVGGEPVPDAIPCRSDVIQDPDHVGCGCTYTQDCYNYIQGVQYAQVNNIAYGDCFAQCDAAGSKCVGLNFEGDNGQCTLFSSITSIESSFTPTSANRTSCAQPCAK